MQCSYTFFFHTEDHLEAFQTDSGIKNDQKTFLFIKIRK